MVGGVKRIRSAEAGTRALTRAGARARFRGMSEINADELRRLALDVGREVGGEGTVEDVEVAPDMDFWGNPIYRFTMLVHPERSPLGPGLFRIRIGQRLKDELVARGEEHAPRMLMVSRPEWDTLATDVLALMMARPRG